MVLIFDSEPRAPYKRHIHHRRRLVLVPIVGRIMALFCCGHTLCSTHERTQFAVVDYGE